MQGRDVETAKNCGASEVGMDDIIEKVKLT